MQLLRAAIYLELCFMNFENTDLIFSTYTSICKILFECEIADTFKVVSSFAKLKPNIQFAQNFIFRHFGGQFNGLIADIFLEAG